VSTATVTLPAELLARAGASDKNRPAWLNERAHGVTATEIRDLYLKARGYPGKTVEQLIAEKLPFLLATSPEGIEAAATGGFGGNKFTAWGNTREPVIAAQLEEQFGMLPESRVFRSAANPRYLASPDGIRVGDDGRLEVAEIKTSGADIAPETDAYRKKGYDIQQTWVCGVIEAWRSLYAWEQHDGDWQDRGGQYPEPEPLDLFVPTAWVSFDDDLFAELVVLADHFLERLDAALVAARAGEGPVIDEEMDTLAVNYLRGLDEEKAGAALKSSSWAAILERVDAGEPVLQETALTRVSFSPAIVETKQTYVTDVAAARAANPELYARLERAQDDASQAVEALEVEARAVAAHETAFVVEAGVERVVVKKAALRVTTAKQTKQEKEKAA